MIRESRWKALDNYKRKLFLKNELKKIILNNIIKNKNINLCNRYFALFNKSKLSRNSSINQQKTRCFLTGRNWYIVKNTKLSRFVFRIESNNGNISGFKRASW
jgi:ribosomal protein S14